MNDFYIYPDGNTLFLDRQKREEWTGPVYSSLEKVDPAVKLSIKRIAKKVTPNEIAKELLGIWMDGLIFRYITDYPHLERLELYCEDEDIAEDKYKGIYTHKLPAIIIHDKYDDSFGNSHRGASCDVFTEPFGDNRISFYFTTFDVDVVFDNGKSSEIIPFPGNNQGVWTADFAEIVDRSSSLFGDYAESLFKNLGTLTDQLRFAIRVVKLYPNRPSFYKDTIIRYFQHAAKLSILQNNSEQLLFVLNLASAITLNQIEWFMDAAQLNHATSCIALLLNYKNSHFTYEETEEYETDKFFKELDNTPLPEYLTLENFSFLAQKDGSLGISSYTGTEKNVVIPSSVGKKQVSVICGEAFFGRNDLERIVIPEGVLDIGTRAFSGCNNLSSLVLPTSITTIGNNVFDGCTTLADSDGFIISQGVLYSYIGTDTDIIVPTNVKEIYNRAFSAMRRSNGLGITRVVLPQGLEKIGPYAFAGCTDLTEINLPSTINRIGEQAFSGCVGLVELTIPYGVNELEPEVFKGCKNLKSVSIPQSITKIRLGAFKGCKSLINIFLPENITEMGDYAFQKCTGLKEISIPNSVQLKQCDSLFENCSNLKSVTLPKTCEEIGRDWFALCSSLREIIIPDGVKRIGLGAFYGCGNLNSVILPESIEHIAANAFRNCSNLCEITLPNNISSIGINAFSFCFSLKEITLPSNCVTIATAAFSSCYSLEKVTVSPNFHTISDNAFSGCTELKTIIIPNVCKHIGENAFDRCQYLTIHAKADSYAAKYAEDNGIKLIVQ